MPQEDYFVEQLEDLTERFHAHYMTKQVKSLRQDKDALEKQKQELVI
jgi:hypothetical protein